MTEQAEQILAVFVLDDDVAARRFLKAVERIDEVDENVAIVDAAFADRSKRGRVKIQQTKRHGRGRSTGIGVVVGAILAGPAGAVVGGAAGGILAGLHHQLNDIGVTEKFMREVGKEVEKGKTALFVLYEGDWSASIGLIEKVVKDEHALLIQSTLPLATAAALRQMVEPAVEELGGEELVEDYEVEMVEETTEDAATAPEESRGDDLTNIDGLGPKSAAVLAAAGVDSYARLAATSEPDLRRILGEAHATVPGNVNTWSMQAAFAAKGDWRGLARYEQMQSQQGAAKPKASTAEAPAAPAKTDDLTQLSGIGTRMASILADGGVTTYEQLQHTSSDDLRRIVSARGKGHDKLWRLLHDRRQRVIAAIGYGTVASEKRSLWASRSFRGNHAVYLRAGTVVDGARKVPTYDSLADGRFKGCPNGRRLWPFWLVKAATGDVRDGKGRRLYPAEDRWIGLVVAKARPIGEPDDGVDPGDPEGETPDLPDGTELLEVIADTAGELEDHIAGLGTSIEALQPYLPTASASKSQPGDGVRP